MKEIDFENLGKLLEEGRFDEARPIIEEFFNSEMTAEEKSAAYVNLALLDTKVRNKINESYVKEMENLIALSDEVQEKGNSIRKQLDLKETRGRIQKI